MEDILYCKYLYNPFELKGVEPANKIEADWKKWAERLSITFDSESIKMCSTIFRMKQMPNTLQTTLESIFDKKNAQNKTCDSKNCKPEIQRQKQYARAYEWISRFDEPAVYYEVEFLW